MSALTLDARLAAIHRRFLDTGDVHAAYVAAIDEAGHALEQRDALLAALKSTLNYWTSTGFAECEPDCDCIVEGVRAAIALTEGQQP